MKRTVCVGLAVLTLFMLGSEAGAQVEEKTITLRGFRGNPIKKVSDLEDKTVAIRIYALLGPESFLRDSAEFQGDGIVVDAARIPESGIVILYAGEQKDEVTRTALRGTVLTWSKEQGELVGGSGDSPRRLRFAMPQNWENQSPDVRKEEVRDALGNEIPRGELSAKLMLAEKDGPVRAYLPFELYDEKNQIAVPGVAGVCEIRYLLIEHPGYGAAVAPRYFSHFGEARLPLVRENTLESTRALRGVIVDPEGRPVPGAIVRCPSARTPGEGLIQGYDNRVMTEKDGSFCIYIADRNRKEERGDIIPPNTNYSVHVTPPEGSQFPPYVAVLSNDTPVQIRLVQGESFHTFAFEDTEGRITDESRLTTIKARTNIPNLEMTRDVIAHGAWLPSCTITAMLDDNSGTEFEPIGIGADSPEEIVFRAKAGESIAYRGQILDGVTGEPLAGAYVLDWCGLGLGEITKSQWEALHRVWPNDLTAEEFDPLRQLYSGVEVITRTDGEGRYELHPRPGKKLFAVIALEEGYIGYMVRRELIPIGSDNEATIPTIRLFPYGKAYITARADSRNLPFCQRWRIAKENNPPWVADLIQCMNQPNASFDHESYLKPNKRQFFPVPADVDVQVDLVAPYNDEVSTIHVPGTIHLASGEEIELGEVEFRSRIKIACEVLDASGFPLEGAPVRRRVKGAWSVVHNTDGEGRAYFYVDPVSKGTFRVDEIEPYKTGRENIIEYATQGRDDEGQVFKLVLGKRG